MKGKRMLRIGVLLFVLCLGLRQPVTVRAEEAVDPGKEVPPGVNMPEPEYLEEEVEADPEEDGIMPYIEPADPGQIDWFLTLDERIRSALLTGDLKISVLDLNIPVSFRLAQIESFSPYISGGIDVVYYRISDKLSSIELQTSMNADERKTHVQNVDNAVTEIIARASAGMSDERKALVIHDYFGTEYDYDFEKVNWNPLPDEIFRCGDMFTGKKGVCQAYAYGYQYIMLKLGVECYTTGSDRMNHAWNIIKIGGSWYHVDCTWDDMFRDAPGVVLHESFLCSDQAFKSADPPHYDWDMAYRACSSTAYDNAYWGNVTSSIIFSGNNAYYVADNTIYRKNTADASAPVALKSLGIWNVWGSASRYYTMAFSGLSLYGNCLYYNTAGELRRMNLDGSNDTLVYKPDTSSGYVFGSRISGDELCYVVKKGHDDSADEQRFSITTGQPVNTQPEPQGHWEVQNGGWYYYDAQGNMATGWTQVSGIWYYMDANGRMKANTWLYLGNTWYYLNSDGSMATRWKNIGGMWYYLNEGSGAMHTGWVFTDGTWYYLDGSGAMQTGWRLVDGSWYYLNSDGSMATRWKNIGGTWYYLNEGSGAMHTGWVFTDGTWYYLYGSGAMAADTWVGDYYVDGSGAWTA